MEQIKQVAQKIFFLPYWLTALISIPCYLYVADVLINGLVGSAYGVVACLLSSYALIISGTAVYRVVKRIKKMITNHRLWKKYRRDFVFRTKISLFPNIMINLFFVMLKLILGFYYHSIWMVALGIYYVCLLILRVSLLRNVHRYSIASESENKNKVTSLYGFYLLLLDIALGGIVLYSLNRGAEYSYPGFLIYAMAAYTFYAVIVAVIGLVRNHRDENTAIITTNILKLTTALVALFALETAMLNTFGKESSQIFRQYIIAATGFAIVTIIFGMALYLIIRFQSANNRKLNFNEK